MDQTSRSKSLRSSERSSEKKHKRKEHKKKRKYSRSRSSSISDSDSNNFKFQSKKAHKNNHKKKKKYKRDRKSSRESRSSRSSKSADRKQLMKHSRYRSRSRSHERVKQVAKTSEPTRPRFKINCGFLSDMIIDNKLKNKQLDEQDIASTGQKLQKNFNVNSQPVPMSQYLSNQSLRVKIRKLENKTYTCELQKCKKKFDTIQLFQKHIQEHKQSLIR